MTGITKVVVYKNSFAAKGKRRPSNGGSGFLILLI